MNFILSGRKNSESPPVLVDPEIPLFIFIDSVYIG
jgi:hypothetical protein